MNPLRVSSSRLDMIAATIELLEADLEGHDALRDALGQYAEGVQIPASWPPPYTARMREYALGRLRRDAGLHGFTLWYILTRIAGERPRAVGFVGFANGPDAEGAIEMGGYIVEEEQSRGYGVEAPKRLGQWALENGIRRVIANTEVDHKVARRVLEHIGFRYVRDIDGGGLPHAQYELVTRDGSRD